MRKVICSSEICKFAGSEDEVDQEGGGFMDSGDNYAVSMSPSVKSSTNRRKSRVDQRGKGKRKRRKTATLKKTLKTKPTAKKQKRRKGGKKKKKKTGKDER